MQDVPGVKVIIHVSDVIKDVPGGFPKSDLLGVTVALIHVAAQRYLAV